jgi:hypothetical protein
MGRGDFACIPSSILGRHFDTFSDEEILGKTSTLGTTVFQENK